MVIRRIAAKEGRDCAKVFKKKEWGKFVESRIKFLCYQLGIKKKKDIKTIVNKICSFI